MLLENYDFSRKRDPIPIVCNNMEKFLLIVDGGDGVLLNIHLSLVELFGFKLMRIWSKIKLNLI